VLPLRSADARPLKLGSLLLHLHTEQVGAGALATGTAAKLRTPGRSSVMLMRAVDAMRGSRVAE